MSGSATAWERVQLARNPARPHSLAYISSLVTGFIELHGDRHFRDDPALIGGMGSFFGRTVMVLGHQKGSDTRENLERNFGMPKPEGYRKALRLMRHAEKFGFPVLMFVDTPAADPGLDSEERGQATAIAENLLALSSLRTPTIATVIGEGGSGGALAISVADRLLMLENAIYAVASPEACAAILWKDANRAPEAAEALKLTAQDLKRFGIVDEIIPEPIPAHENPDAVIERVGAVLDERLTELEKQAASPAGIDGLLEARYRKYRRIGAWMDSNADAVNGRKPTSARRNNNRREN